MAEKNTIARPYARALFEDALQCQQTAEWLPILQRLAAAAQDPDTVSLLGNPQVSDDQLIDLFFSVASPTSQLKEPVKNFISLLTGAKRLSLLPEILVLYHQLLTEKEGIIEVKVISAKPVEDMLRKKIQLALEKKLQSKVAVEYGLDESLIGGAVIRAGNRIIDGSIKGKLNRLAESLQ